MVEFNLEEQLEISKQMAAKYDVIERHNKLFDFHIKHLPTKKPQLIKCSSMAHMFDEIKSPRVRR